MNKTLAAKSASRLHRRDARSARRGRLSRRPLARDGAVPRAQDGPAAVPRRRGRRRQDRDRQGAVATLGRRLIRLQCYEGLDVAAAVYEWNYAAQMIAIRVAEARGRARPRAARARRVLRALPDQAAAAAGARARHRRRAGAADRRTRPRRRGLRGVPARSAGRLPGHHPGARHRQGGSIRRSSSSPRTARAKSTTRSSAAASITGSAIRTPSAN